MTTRKAGGRSTRQWMLWAFKLHGCADCGIKPPDVALPDLHCHHRDPGTKIMGGQSRSVWDTQGSLQAHNTNFELLDELLKCEVLCNDCHRDRHRNGHVDTSQLALFGGTGHAWKSL